MVIQPIVSELEIEFAVSGGSWKFKDEQHSQGCGSYDRQERMNTKSRDAAVLREYDRSFRTGRLWSMLSVH
jgi:hypothetical protein